MEKINITPDKFENICRTCLTENNLVSLFNKNNNYAIFEMLMAIAQVKIEITDGLPTKICHSCINTLNVAFHFKQQSVSIDSKLREILYKYPAKNNKNNVKYEISSVNSSNDPSDDYACTIKNENSLEADDDREENITKEQVKLEVANKNGTINCTGDDQKNDVIKKPYFCGICYETFSSTVILKKHLLSVHAQTKINKTETEKNVAPIHNNVHNKKIASKGRLKQHLRKQLEETSFTCKTCNHTFKAKRYYARHMKIHSAEKAYKCETCGKAFTQRYTLTEHMRCHTDERPFKCKFCDQSFKRYYRLSRHQLNDHSELNTLDYECNVCKKAFASRPALNAHSNIHWVKRYNCPQCNKQFSSLPQMENHLERHENPIKKVKVCSYLCNFCGKVFSDNSSLVVHLRGHTQERPFSCSYCPKMFRTKYGLQNHENGHNGIRPFACDQCGRTFRQRFHLVIHKRTHTGEKPYKCTVCDKTFRIKRSLTLHLNTHTGNTPYICTVCEKGYFYFEGLQKHLKKYHSTNKNDK